MLIEAIDAYWVRIPLALVWKTSYADQHDTDTILVRLEGGGHHARGDSRRDLGTPEIVLGDAGKIATSRVPGIAQEPDPDLLEQWTVQHASFRP